MQISVASARRLCQAVFADKLGCASDVADAAVEALIDANLRGVDSHGVQVLPYYLQKWSAGQIVPNAELEVVHDSPATVLFDGHHGIGHYVSRRVMESAISRADEFGIAAAVARNSTHNGAISHYTIQAARAGMIGIAGTACAPHVAPHGGTEGLHGTNPISYALPRDGSDPFVFDCSTGHSAAKMKAHAEREGALPPGRLIDNQGRPTTDPGDLKGGWILPVAGHIGYGLGLLVDGLTSALTGSPIGRQLPLAHDTSGPYYGSFFALAISPQAFAGFEAFSGQINELAAQIESHPPQDPASPVRWPGQRGWEIRDRRLQEGISVADSIWETLKNDLHPYGIEIDAF